MEAADRRALNAAMARLADGDRSAFSPVFATLWPLLHGFARTLVRDEAEAEDAAQHALLKVYEHASRFDPERDAAAWAVAIAANECRATRRRLKLRQERTEPLPAADDQDRDVPASNDADPESEAITRNLLAAAADALGTLSPEDIATLKAAWRGERAAIAPATFRKRVQRATERLRAAWRSRHGTP
jgi:RNA polymerase sigma-70 factor (ECF subfamily)